MILLTGSTGLLGSHLLSMLNDSGQMVRALVRRYPNPDAIKALGLRYPHLVEWVIGDVLDVVSVARAMKGVRRVFHCAAFVSFRSEDRARILNVNVKGTTNMVNLALDEGVDYFVHVSSIAALGSKVGQYMTDEGEPWDDVPKGSVYGQSKYLSEREVWRGIGEGLPAVIVNPSVILGPGDWTKGSSALFKSVWEGLKYFTLGINGYVDVRDVAKAMLFLNNKEIIGERFVLNGSNLDYKTLFEMIAKALKCPPPVRYVTSFEGEIAWRLYALKSLFSKSAPLVTKETARAAQRIYRYSSEKIERLGFNFTPIEITIEDTAQRFVSERSGGISLNPSL